MMRLHVLVSHDRLLYRAPVAKHPLPCEWVRGRYGWPPKFDSLPFRAVSSKPISARRCGTYKDEQISEVRQNDHLAIFVQYSVAHHMVRHSLSVDDGVGR